MARWRLAINGGQNWLDVEQMEPGAYQIVDTDLPVSFLPPNARLGLGFYRWDDDVENMEPEGSDSDLLGVSTCVRWQNVVLCLPGTLAAPSLRELKQAFLHVSVRDYSPDDI